MVIHRVQAHQGPQLHSHHLHHIIHKSKIQKNESLKLGWVLCQVVDLLEVFQKWEKEVHHHHIQVHLVFLVVALSLKWIRNKFLQI